MEAIPLPEFTPMLWALGAGLFIVCGLIIVRGNRGGEVSTIEAALTPFALPLCLVGLITLGISGIGSLLLTVGKTTAVPVALGLTVLIMVLSYFASKGGSSEAHH